VNARRVVDEVKVRVSAHEVDRRGAQKLKIKGNEKL
jgi:hypothetical protein